MSERLCDQCGRMRPASHFYARTGTGRCKGKVRWDQARRFRLMTYIDAGLSNEHIGRKLGVSAQAVILARKRYGIGPTLATALSATSVASLMGAGCSKAVGRWIDAGLLTGKRIRRMGPNRGWMVQRSDLYAFVEDERTWHVWEVERITDPALKRYAEKVRGAVRFLTPGEVAERMYVVTNTVNQWIRKGYLPARRWGNWRIDERELARFELPRIGGRRKEERRAA